jgi:hypothetical protein
LFSRSDERSLLLLATRLDQLLRYLLFCLPIEDFALAVFQGNTGYPFLIFFSLKDAPFSVSAF